MCDCERALELISLGLDGVRTAEESRELAEHLETCPACRSLARDLEELHTAIPELEEEVPAGFRQAVMDRVRQEGRDALPAVGGGRGMVRRWLSMAAVFAVILVGAGALVRMIDYSSAGSAAGGAAMAEPAPQSVGAPAPQDRMVPEGEPFSTEENTAADRNGRGLPRCVQAQIASDQAFDGADMESSVQRTPTEEEQQRILENCAAWVQNSGLVQKDRIDMEQVTVEPLDADGWRVTIGEDGDAVVLLCDSTTLEVVGQLQPEP